MSRIRSKDTRPELRLRRLVHSMGYRYRLHLSDLPGRPDLVFTGRHSVIFMHGCYWHRHDCPRGRSMPRKNSGLWDEKFRRTIARDQDALRLLATQGWRALVVWECELADDWTLPGRLKAFLDT